MKFINTIIFITFTLSAMAQLQQDSTYVYKLDGTKDWFYIQKDVYCFKTDSAQAYSGNVHPCVDQIDYWSNSEAKFNEICFDSTSPMSQRISQVQQIQNDSVYSMSSYSLTREKDAHNSEEQYYRTDDKILVTFNDPNLGDNAIISFMKKYSLELVHEPFNNLSNSVSWTYIFRIVPREEQDITSIRLAQIINEDEPALVKLAEPNVFATEPLNCNPTSEVGLNPGNVDGTWHIRNTGNTIWNGTSGTQDADADICDCWGEGYTGKGVKVGIIDFGGIEFSHDDFQGTNINQVFNANTSGTSTMDTYIDPGDGHGMLVSGVIGATPNNTSLGQRYAVGSAYDSEIRPYLNTSPGSNSQISTSIQKAVSDEVDIINMSFKTNDITGSIETQINNAINTGRPDPNAPGGNWGTVCVAGTGNTDGAISHFPANMQFVMGVGWSNPEDYRSSSNAPGSGNGWTVNSGEGSTYGPPSYEYDVVAPGELIMTTDLAGTNGTFLGDYANVKASSYSTPIVSSIAAMVLEKNPNLTFAQVLGFIRNGAEEVNPSTYDYSMFPGAPGYNNEMFYGRVSCINSLNDVFLSNKEHQSKTDLTVHNLNGGKYRIYLPQNSGEQTYQIYDLSGKIIEQGKVTNEIDLQVNLSSYSKGVYIFKLIQNQRQVASQKLIR